MTDHSIMVINPASAIITDTLACGRLSQSKLQKSISKSIKGLARSFQLKSAATKVAENSNIPQTMTTTLVTTVPMDDMARPSLMVKSASSSTSEKENPTTPLTWL
jgi:hypothetical protein